MGGPTQNYEDEALGQWTPRPALAVAVRVLVVALPPATSLAFGLAAAHWFPPRRLGVGPWTWFALDLLGSLAVLWLTGRAVRRLLPLGSLLRLALIFPDQAPSRFATAIRHHSTQALQDRITALQSGGALLRGEDEYASDLLELVAAISLHDAITRGHSERVQAYAAMIADELGLSKADASKVRWAALLHDVGKLHVPYEILNKTSRPTDDEWTVLCSHPAEGIEIAAPLADWLGPYLSGIGQHHEKWDGSGYPDRLAGTDIHLSARIISVADTYDVITSARSYKKPMSAAAARAELTRCAGTQFDPEIVRAFLAIGIGRLRRTSGPLSLLSTLPGLRFLPLVEAASRTAAVATASLAVVTATTTTALVAHSAPTRGALVALPAHGTVAVHAVPVAAHAVPVTDPTASSPASSPAPVRLPSPTGTGRPSTPAAVPSWAHGGAPGARAGRIVASPSSAAALPTSARPSVPVPPAPAPRSTTSTPSPASPCSRARAGSTSMAGANLSGCNLAGTTLTGDYSNADLSAADLHGAVLKNLTLAGATLTGADLGSASVSSTSFNGAHMVRVVLDGATISHVSFLGTDLSSAHLHAARIDNTAFDDARLQGADLSGAAAGNNLNSFPNANLARSDLASTDLSGADLHGVDLRRADLSGTNLAAADLRNADLHGATGTPAAVQNAQWGPTICPDGSTRNAACF